MLAENTLTTLNSIDSDLKVVKELAYDKCGFDLTNLETAFGKVEGALSARWGYVTKKQAAKTQSWQTKYFLTIKYDNSIDIELTKKL